MAAAPALGAAGVVVGARFVASVESEAHPGYKQRLIEACETDTVVSSRRRVEWPPDAPYRLLRSAITDGNAPPLSPIARVRRGGELVDLPLFTSAAPTIHTEGRTELMANYARQGVGLVRQVLPAATIVEQMVADAAQAIRGLQRLMATA